MKRRELLCGLTSFGLSGLAGCERGPGGSVAPIVPTERPSPQRPPTPPRPHDEDPFTSLRGFCDDIDAPSAQERGEFREKTRKILGDMGLAAVVCEPGTHMKYLTGVWWRVSERPFMMVLTPRGEPAWVCPAFEEETAREQLGNDARVLVWQEHESPYDRVDELVGARGKVAVDPAMRTFLSEGVARAVGGRRVARSVDPVGRARIVKTTAELARLRRANEATKAALAAVADSIHEGMMERDLKGLVSQAQEAAGLTQVWTLSLFGPSAAYPHGTRKGHALREGEFVLVDTGGDLHGYQSDITRTWPLGTPTAEGAQVWNVVRDAQRAGLEKIRPGMPSQAADAAARKVIEDAGFGPDYVFFTHRLGHGIGMKGHEPPYLVRGNQRVLQPGMTMSDEPGIYARGKFGVRLEDIVAVTHDGHEVFGPLAESLDRPFG